MDLNKIIMRTLKLIFLCSFVVLASTETWAQECIGIAIDKAEFDKAVDRINELYEKGDISKVEDFLLSARLYNTLGKNSLVHQDKRYESLRQQFEQKYLRKIVKKLDATISVGMGFYSKKYDIYIGGAQLPHKNSMFCIR